MIEAELHVIGGKHAGQVIPLNRKKFLIGRESDCQLRPNSELVSRHHCVFGIDEYSVRLRDLGSTNGTTVNGERIVKETTLVAGDRVVVGNLEFEFRVLNPASGTGDETVVSNTETVMEITSQQEGQPAVAPAAPVEQTPPPPGATQQISLPVDQPQPASGDTTVIAQQPMMPGQAPYQPMMPQPMGYPGQMYGGYPYQPQPPMPMMPGQMPGYPQQQPMMPGQMPGYPQQPTPAPVQQPPADAAPTPADQAPEVSLPDPSETGVSEEPPKKQAEQQQGSGGGGGADDGDSTTAAADIIRQYTQRRPG